MINKINNLNNNNPYKGLNLKEDSFIVKTVSKCADINQTKSDIFKAGGKVIISPPMIAFNPFTKLDKEDRKYNALIVPIEAGIALLSALLSFKVIGKHLDKLRKNNKLNHIYKDNKCYQILKDRIFFLSGLITIPITSKILNIVFPKFVNPFFKDKKN